MSRSDRERRSGSRAVPLAELAARLDMPLDDRFRAAARRLPVRFPEPYAALIDPGDPADPIRRIGWPDPEESGPDPEAIADPVGEGSRRLHPRLIRKYGDRALLLVTGRCHFYCRFCFRAGSGAEGDATPEEIDEALARLACEEGVTELILSGGDPLVLPDERLSEILAAAAARLPALRTIRVHTRAPIHDPARITEALARRLAAGPLPVWVVIHATHPKELTGAVAEAVSRLRGRGLPLGSQTVLLRGVNDRSDTLAGLFGRLYALGVRPIYLHHPDRVAGAARFRIGIDEGRRLYRSLRGRLPGPALPAYVIDLPDGSGKVPVDWLEPAGERLYRIERPDGRESLYRDIAPLPAHR